MLDIGWWMVEPEALDSANCRWVQVSGYKFQVSDDWRLTTIPCHCSLPLPTATADCHRRLPLPQVARRRIELLLPG